MNGKGSESDLVSHVPVAEPAGTTPEVFANDIRLEVETMRKAASAAGIRA